MESMVAVILGGGKGTRLFPLTKDRSKPAVPLAGKYRLIDIPVSNCINSQVRRIHILTMYQSASLNSHISQSYRFDSFSGGFVQVLAAEQTATSNEWFQGTADAVRQCLPHILDTPMQNVLILSGDHLYRMDYRDFLRCHVENNAEVSIAVKPVTRKDAPELGLLKIDETGRIIKFVEKPKTPQALNEMKVDTTVVGVSPKMAEKYCYLASMGIYIFQRDALRSALFADPSQTDFGKEIIPAGLENHRVQAYCFGGYWADIGTVSAFYAANMDLVRPTPKFNLFDPQMPIYTNTRFLPGAKVNRASVEGAILCDGTVVDGAMVRESILGVRTRVRPGASIESSLIMGADAYQQPHKPGEPRVPFVGIGEGAYLKNAIVDKNASIGAGTQLVNREKYREYDDPEARFFVRDGIIVVPKNAVVPEGFIF
jgi:glucose-1-phosphate adenylyltransferase